jgi:hypothetical protein
VIYSGSFSIHKTFCLKQHYLIAEYIIKGQYSVIYVLKKQLKTRSFAAQYEHTDQIMNKFNIIDNSVLVIEKSRDFYCEINGFFRCAFNC